MTNRVWTPEKLALLKDRYATSDNKDLAELLGFDRAAIRGKAFSLGLLKTHDTLSKVRSRDDSFLGRVRQLLVAADARGLRAVTLGELTGVDAEVAQKALGNLTGQRKAWRVRGRRGETRWFGTQAWADAFEQARAAPVARSAWPTLPQALASTPPRPAPVPLNVTERTRHTVAPPPPERFGGAPVECSFSNLRPGEYLPLAPSRWVDAITRPR